MNDALADLEALALRCRAERAREYIHEAIQCYRAGAYRSAIVNTWIAVVFDLVDKIRELTLSGDAAAQAINTQYETYIAQINSGNDQGVKNALEFERNILITCRDRLQFFDHQQVRDLDRLKEDRHQCAHPSFQKAGEPYRPTAEHARLHLRTAVEHVLSQPPMQGRSAIAELVSIVGSEYFPRNRVQAAATLRSTSLAAASEALIRGFVDALVFGYAQAASPLYRKEQVGYALSALLDMQRPTAEPRVARQLSKLARDVEDDDISSVAILISAIAEATDLIEQPARIRLIEFIRTGPEAEVVKSLAALSNHSEVQAVAQTRILSFGVERLAEAIASHNFGSLAKERALALLSQARNWDRVNEIFAKLIMPIFDSLTRVDIERIIRMPTETNADLPGSSGYSKFIGQVRRTALMAGPEVNALMRAHNAGYLIRDDEEQG
jgi:hypothetical protein